MTSARIILLGLATWIVPLFWASSLHAQAYFYRWDNGGANLNWGTGTNWGPNPPLNLGVNNVTPSAYFEEGGLINNGNTVQVTTSQTQFSISAANNAAATAGVIVDGITAPGNGSTLSISSGGTLSVLVTYGGNGAPPDSTPTAGSGNVTLNNGGAITVQPGGTLSVGGDVAINSGTLTVGGVAAGGVLTTRGLNATTSNSTVNLTGSATVNASNATVLNGTTSISGPNVVFNTASVSLSNTSVFSPVITSAAVPAGTGHSVINVTGGVSLNGTLRPQFLNGVVPHLGDVWTLFDSAQVQGNVAASDATGTGAALPTGLRYAITTTKVGSVRGVKSQLTVENFLTAEVNRANGQVTIRNTNTTTGPGVSVIGYQIGSPAGALKPSAFSSAFGGTWESANLSVNSLGELNSSGSSLVGLNGSAPLGNIYDPVSLQTTFGTTPVSDLTFSYTRSDGRTVNAPVTYVNTGLANTFVLQVDPNDGKARIINDSIFSGARFDGYQVTSNSGSLRTTWNSLQDQSVAGWEEASPTTSTLAELNPLSLTTVNAGQTAATMTGLFNTGGVPDLQFNFRLTVVAGDYNLNGIIEAGDFVIWRDTLNSTTDLRANGDNTGASANKIDAADYAVWRANFGRPVGGVFTGVVRYQAFSLGSSSASGELSAVPEPSTALLALIPICGLVVARSRIK